MRRSKYDPPEYRDWSLDPAVFAELEHTIESNAARRAVIEGLSANDLMALYAGMVRFRLFDTMLSRWVRQGVISKAWLGTGEEAVSIGCARALTPGDVIGPMIRNAGACFEMGMPMGEHFAGYLGTVDSGSAGRDLHVGDLSHGVIAPISHVGSLLPVLCGHALAYSLRGDPRVALTWVGDGATRTGEIHEAVNFAAVRRLPIAIVVQNNRVALGTRTEAESVAPYEAWLTGYGMAVESMAGNNVLDVYAAARLAVDRCRRGEGPVGLVAHTFRMGGHATHDEAEARAIFSREEFEHWGRRDPIGVYEAWLAASGRIGSPREAALATLSRLEEAVEREVEEAATRALERRQSQEPDPRRVTTGVYAE